MTDFISWLRWFWDLAHQRLLEDIEERESLARIRWAKTMNDNKED